MCRQQKGGKSLFDQGADAGGLSCPHAPRAGLLEGVPKGFVAPTLEDTDMQLPTGLPCCPPPLPARPRSIYEIPQDPDHTKARVARFLYYRTSRPSTCFCRASPAVILAGAGEWKRPHRWGHQHDPWPHSSVCRRGMMVPDSLGSWVGSAQMRIRNLAQSLRPSRDVSVASGSYSSSPGSVSSAVEWRS